jgi:aminoglycoside/choline kinase family phosphotransferase
MTSVEIEKKLSELFEKWSGKKPDLVLPLAPSASPRIYYRLAKGDTSAIGTYNLDKKENHAFLTFSRHFHKCGLPVPEIYSEDPENYVYLQEDLGATTLYSYLLKENNDFPDYLVEIYKRVVEKLAQLQVTGGRGLDYTACYPRSEFDKQSMLWDFNTFKYYFVKLAGIPFDEQQLETDMHNFAEYLLGAGAEHFMFRDFQARNIMIRNGQPFFIDYQGGRKGAPQYDLASLLFQAKANMPVRIKKELLQHYMDKLEQLTKIDRQKFEEYFYGYALMRCIQTFGTYGFRGIFEKKEYFIKSIPYALNNAKWILENAAPPIDLPELYRVLKELISSKKFAPFDKSKASGNLLTVNIQSFSFKRGIPKDDSGHGGGFVFDVRFIHNPGRYEPYKKMTGRDEPVINFLKHHSCMEDFLNNVFLIVDPAIENYLERSFTNLSVSFGCTGGQHRSVYAADRLARHIEEKYGVKVVLKHLEQEMKGWKN